MLAMRFLPWSVSDANSLHSNDFEVSSGKEIHENLVLILLQCPSRQGFLVCHNNYFMLVHAYLSFICIFPVFYIVQGAFLKGAREVLSEVQTSIAGDTPEETAMDDGEQAAVSATKRRGAGKCSHSGVFGFQSRILP